MANPKLLELSAAFDCVHCGLCLDACPTYHATGQENHSPRGRVALIRAIAEDRITTKEVNPNIDACMLCRACEPACPSQVNYHSLIEEFRDGKTPLIVHAGKPWLLALMKFLRKAGIMGLIEKFGNKKISALAGSIPSNPQGFTKKFHVPEARNPVRGTVAIHLGCVQKSFFGPSLEATAKLLAREGFNVVIPPQPNCCGSSWTHFGNPKKGAELAQSTAKAFEKDYMAVISLSAGCSAHMASQFSIPVIDPLIFLQQQGLRNTYKIKEMRIAWDPPCQLEHVLQGAGPMRDFLQNLLQGNLLDPERSDLCCGAGGVTFAQSPEIADDVTKLKIKSLLELEPEIILSANPPCRMRLEHGLRKEGLRVPILHPIEWLQQYAENLD